MSKNIIIKKNAEKTFDNSCIAAALSAAKPDDTLVFDGLSLDGKPYGFSSSLAKKSRGVYLTTARDAVVSGETEVSNAKKRVAERRTRGSGSGSGSGKTVKYPYSLSIVGGLVKIDCNGKMAAVVQPDSIVKFNLSNAGAARLMRLFGTDGIRSTLTKLNITRATWAFPDGTVIDCNGGSANDALAAQAGTMIKNGDIKLAQNVLSGGLPTKKIAGNDISDWISKNYPLVNAPAPAPADAK